MSSSQRADLIERYIAGERAHELARAFGVHRTTVAEIVERAGVKRSWAMTAGERQAAIACYAEGLSCERIGHELGRDAQTVRRALVDAGVPLRGPHGEPREEAA